MDKKELRRIIRLKKEAMTEAEIIKRSRELTAKFIMTEAYINANTIYGYLSYNQEVRTEEILQQAFLDGKRVAVPKVFGEEMRFICIDSFDHIVPGYKGIPEPIADGPVADDSEALVLMPGLAFTEAGARMGYGGGFYDKYLALEPEHYTVALCYDFQVLKTLPTEEFDIPVDKVIWA